MAERPTLERRLTLRDLDVEAPSDDESISVANNEPLAGGSARFNDSIRSDDDGDGSDHANNNNNDEIDDLLGTSAHDKLIESLGKLGISEEIDTSDMEEVHRRLSDVTFSDKSYIMDLGRQQASREETIRKEAFEDAHIWYEKALSRGMGESNELLANFFSQTTEEVRENYKEYHKKQDEWLNQALDDYQKKLSAGELEKLKKAAPTDDDVKKQKLEKKISKTEKLMKRAWKKEGEDSEAYKNYEKKLGEYKAKREELESLKKKTRRKSKDGKRKSGNKKKSKSSKRLDLDDDEVSKARSTKSSKTTRTGKKLKKKKRDKTKASRSSRSLRVSASNEEESKKSSSTKVLVRKKKEEKQKRQASLPT